MVFIHIPHQNLIIFCVKLNLAFECYEDIQGQINTNTVMTYPPYTYICIYMYYKCIEEIIFSYNEMF